MKTIIIPTDFSAIATNAMNYGVELAKTINANILLLHVYQIPVSVSDVPVVIVSAEDLKKDAEKNLASVKEELEHITSGKITIYTEARLGDVISELEDACNKMKPVAVVMGTKGASGIERAMFGSVTLGAIRHLTWPVICIPPGKQFGGGIKKIGFACDFKKVVETTPVHFIKNMIKEFNAELHVLNVDYENRHFTPDTPEQSLLLHTMLEDMNPVYDFIEQKGIEDGINEFAEKNNLDLIIAIPKKHNLLESIFKPSSTKKLVIQSHIPVMCIHE